MIENKIKILHLTYDYAEENKGDSTVVIGDFINETKKFSDIKVISLKRITNPFKEKLDRNSDSLIKYSHFGLPYGIFLKSNMSRIAKNLLRSVLNRDNDFDFIHAHKLTFEGIIGYKIAKKLNKKLIISIRQTDFYVLRYRIDLIPYIKKILSETDIVLYIAPYMIDRLKLLLGSNFITDILFKFYFLPNPINFNLFNINESQKENFYLSVLWLNYRSVKRKNLLGLLKAIKLVDKKKLRLKIIGKGDYERKIKLWIKELRLEEQVELLGFKENNEIKYYLSKSKGLLLPSFSETFGVAYAEALLCGVPILYSKGTGFDGLFDNVGYAADPNSIKSIAEGINFIEQNNTQLHHNISELKAKGAFDIFKKENVAMRYYTILKEHL